MSNQEYSKRIFLIYAIDDQSWARRFELLVSPLGYYTFPTSGDAFSGARSTNKPLIVKSAIQSCSFAVVLIGKRTHMSRWVDQEIAWALTQWDGKPAAGLLGIVLPEHEDFGKPYYEPSLVPGRLHDRVRWEYALIRKWSEDPAEISARLQEADRRRRAFLPIVSYSMLQTLHRQQWDESEDAQREVENSLRAHV
jgi:hypothetical protein